MISGRQYVQRLIVQGWFAPQNSYTKLFPKSSLKWHFQALIILNLSCSQTICRKIDMIYEVCHEKTDLKVFVIVIPKEGLARMATPILLLVWHQLFRIWLCWHLRLYSQKVSVVPTTWYGMTTTKTCFLVMCIIFITIVGHNPYKEFVGNFRGK